MGICLTRMIDAPIRQSPDEDNRYRFVNMEFAMPNRLVQLALDHDRMFTY